MKQKIRYHRTATILHDFGQWVVTTSGVQRRYGACAYNIEANRIHEEHPGWNWEQHMIEKGWEDMDINSFRQAMQKARELFPPQKG